MQHSFKTIAEASKIKTQCPFCDKELILTLTNSLDEKSATKMVIWSDIDTLKLSVQQEQTTVEATIIQKSNDFTYVVRTDNELVESLDTAGNWLNLSYFSFHKECSDCGYLISFAPLRFDMTLKKIYGLKIHSEQWVYGEYKIHNEYLSHQCYIYQTRPDYYKVVTTLPRQELLTKEAAEKSQSWLKNIITFS